MGILIHNGRVIDPASGKDDIYDILVENGNIVKVDHNISQKNHDIVDATGCFVMPGLIDLHVHFREPGFEYKETIKTGSMAAARGGITTVVPMPNTNPAVDSVEVIDRINKIIEQDAIVNVLQSASITLSQDGKVLTDLAALKQAGVVAISEDGKSVMNAEIYRQAMKAAAEYDLLVMAHCEDKSMAGKGAMNQGKRSEELGIPGITNGVEDIIVARDILLSEETKCRLHLCHCSTKGSVKMIDIAKKMGIQVTGEVCPHHFVLTDEDIMEDNADFKMNPPLRSRKDVQELAQGLKNNIMDAISTDHAPHSAEEKARPFATAPFGITGLETSLCLTYTELVLKGYLTPMQMVEKMSYNPAQILKINKGTLLPTRPADITIMNPDEEFVIHREDFVSLGKNTPFDGRKVKGKVKITMVNGHIVYDAR